MALGYRLEATYESGYVHREMPEDISPYDPTRNTFNDILNGRPTKAGHGRMTQFSLIPEPEDGRKRWDIDWTQLWDLDDPRPIYFRVVARVWDYDLIPLDEGIALEHRIGYQYRENGRNVQEVIKIVNDEATRQEPPADTPAENPENPQPELTQ